MSDRRPTVMFVDDEESVLNSIRRLTVDEPYDVHMHVDPHRALAEVEFNPPDVVFADYMMPTMTGPEFLRRVMDLDNGVVRIVLTGKPGLANILRAVNDGQIYRFMLKPWDDDELLMAIKSAIDYGKLKRERDHMLVEMDKRRVTIEALERRDPGISKLPQQDAVGAFILGKKDLPKGG